MENEPINRLIEMLKDPNEVWDIGGYTCAHRKTGIRVWIANGRAFCRTWPANSGESMLQRWRLWRAVRVARKNWLARKLNASTVEVENGK